MPTRTKLHFMFNHRENALKAHQHNHIVLYKEITLKKQF